MKKAFVLVFLLGWAVEVEALTVTSQSTQVAKPDVDRSTVTVANASDGNVVFCRVGQDATTADTQVAKNTSGVFATTDSLFCISPLGSTVTITETLRVAAPLVVQVTCGNDTAVLTQTQTRGKSKLTFIGETATAVHVCPVSSCTDAAGVSLIASMGPFVIDRPHLTQWWCDGSTALVAVLE